MAKYKKNKAVKALAKKTAPKSKGKKITTYSVNEESGEVNEPVALYNTQIRAIGNSRGVILNNLALESAGLNANAGITIKAGKGVITITQAKETGINTNLSTWDQQFKAAIKQGAKPESDPFKDIQNDFDTKEW